MPPPKSLFAAVVAASLAVFSGACRSSDSTTAAAAPQAGEPTALEVIAIEAQNGDLAEALSVSGTLTPQTRVGIASKLPGRLDRVLVNIGDRVRAGQVVASLDHRELDAQADAAAAAVSVAKAGLESAEASLSNAALEHDRARNLFERGAIPRQRLDAAETARRAASAQRDLARAHLAQAEAALRHAREVVRDATLYSPIPGAVVERNYDAGNLVSPGDEAVLVVADTRTLKLEAGVGELEAGRLRVGMRAAVTAPARPGVTYEGRLAAIAPEIDPKNRQFRVEVRVPNGAGDLLSGMYATARIQTARAADAVIVPRESVTTRQGQRVVFRISGDRVQPAPVVEGLADDTRVQIVSGVAGGELLVADARKALEPGQPVRPVRAGR
jgi:RND family efflux transporter MFP subunit